MNLMFGGVPLVTSQITTEESLKLPRSTEQEVWIQAASDFERAATLLPSSPSVFGKIDKYDAMAFLARVNLQQNNWNNAVTVLGDIYNNSGHELEPVWTDMWTLEAEKTSKEYMLSSIWSNFFPNNFYAQAWLYKVEDLTAQGYFLYKPGLYSSFEVGDIRRDATVGFASDGRPENNKYDFGFIGTNWTMDIVVLRFSDIVLMYAEALSMANNSVQQQSFDLMNDIRSRAGLTDLTATEIPDMDAFVEAILAERRVEFLWEGTRYADLKRHNALLRKLNDIGYVFDESYLTIPVPQSEIDKVAPGLYD